MKRIVLGLEYDGSAYNGWQAQKNGRSIQSVVEQALSSIADQPVTVVCAGRTDSGVHALEQVVHFDVDVERPLHAWMLGGNSQLPEDVRIIWARHGVGDFHARYSAIARFYRYIILNRPAKSALLRRQVAWCYHPLDAESMHQGAQFLLGNHDFSSFRAQYCQSRSPFRMLHFCNVYRDHDRVVIDISANAFLHHMVRNIAGVLMQIGMGRKPPEWVRELLMIKDRSQGGVTAEAEGLYLAAVCYPEHYQLPRHPVFEQLPADAQRFDAPAQIGI